MTQAFWTMTKLHALVILHLALFTGNAFNMVVEVHASSNGRLGTTTQHHQQKYQRRELLENDELNLPTSAPVIVEYWPTDRAPAAPVAVTPTTSPTQGSAVSPPSTAEEIVDTPPQEQIVLTNNNKTAADSIATTETVPIDDPTGTQNMDTNTETRSDASRSHMSPGGVVAIVVAAMAVVLLISDSPMAIHRRMRKPKPILDM
jgi:hypothetical protein